MSRMFNNDVASAPGQGSEAKVVVKWFNAVKGFGFVAPTDGSPDAFLHISVLHRAGMQQLNEGTEMRVLLAPSARGQQVTQIIEVTGQVAVPQDGGGNGRSDRGGGRGGRSGGGGRFGGGDFDRGGFDRGGDMGGPEVEMDGTVKWYKADKGFGFIAAEDGSKDIFVHRTLLQGVGMNDIEPGTRVRVKFRDAQRGREATWIAVGDRA